MDTNLKDRDSYVSKKGTLSYEKMVLSLLERYENKGHVLYVEIFYSSPNLYLKLQKKASSETQGQIVGARKSLNGRKNMAQKESKER